VYAWMLVGEGGGVCKGIDRESIKSKYRLFVAFSFCL
jgi:hypothetical protein